MQKSLLSHISHLAEGPFVDLVLLGTYVPPPQVDHYTQLLFHELKLPNITMSPIPDFLQVTLEDNQQAWNIRRKAYLPTHLVYCLVTTKLLPTVPTTIRWMHWYGHYPTSSASPHWHGQT